MGLFSKDASLEKLAAAVEQLVKLYTLDLASRGLSLEDFQLEGAVLDTDDEQITALEREEERKRQNGLAPGGNYAPTQPSGEPWPPEPGLFPSSSYAWLGPEGAETAFQGPPEVRSE
jgi:hypothetical protein